MSLDFWEIPSYGPGTSDPQNEESAWGEPSEIQILGSRIDLLQYIMLYYIIRLHSYYVVVVVWLLYARLSTG